MYEDYHLTLSPTIEMPSDVPPVDTSHYRRLLDIAPPYAVGLPYLLNCMVEQIVRLHVTEDEGARAPRTPVWTGSNASLDSGL